MEVIKKHQPFIATIELTEEEIRILVGLFHSNSNFSNMPPEDYFKGREKDMFDQLEGLLAKE
jgi:hypothetical protein